MKFKLHRKEYERSGECSIETPARAPKNFGGAVDFVQILVLTHDFGQILKFIIFYP